MTKERNKKRETPGNECHPNQRGVCFESFVWLIPTPWWWPRRPASSTGLWGRWTSPRRSLWTELSPWPPACRWLWTRFCSQGEEKHIKMKRNIYLHTTVAATKERRKMYYTSVRRCWFRPAAPPSTDWHMITLDLTWIFVSVSQFLLLVLNDWVLQQQCCFSLFIFQPQCQREKKKISVSFPGNKKIQVKVHSDWTLATLYLLWRSKLASHGSVRDTKWTSQTEDRRPPCLRAAWTLHTYKCSFVPWLIFGYFQARAENQRFILSFWSSCHVASAGIIVFNSSQGGGPKKSIILGHAWTHSPTQAHNGGVGWWPDCSIMKKQLIRIVNRMRELNKVLV